MNIAEAKPQASRTIHPANPNPDAECKEIGSGAKVLVTLRHQICLWQSATSFVESSFIIRLIWAVCLP
ncbi:hypothetical protein [Acrocarpospora phusangensis]|uniref:hypothetical protein n=1 Tax=Acrocarpospora phusangensis TaxID=1070424 RepID=UPI00194F2610|nr:hypothetical protein [Acrocarpospora phusangensis]